MRQQGRHTNHCDHQYAPHPTRTRARTQQHSRCLDEPCGGCHTTIVVAVRVIASVPWRVRALTLVPGVHVHPTPVSPLLRCMSCRDICCTGAGESFGFVAEHGWSSDYATRNTLVNAEHNFLFCVKCAGEPPARLPARHHAAFNRSEPPSTLSARH